MEDCHRILPTLGPDLETFSYFGIYDGHGGRQIVDFLEDAFEQNIIIELKEPDEASVLERLSRYEVCFWDVQRTLCLTGFSYSMHYVQSFFDHRYAVEETKYQYFWSYGGSCVAGDRQN